MSTNSDHSESPGQVRADLRSLHDRLGNVHRLNLPGTAPEGEEEMYAALVAYGGAILHAESGCVTELIRPDGRVAARIVPA